MTKCPVCLGEKIIRQMLGDLTRGWREIECPACDGFGEPVEGQWWLGKVGEADGIVAQLNYARWTVRGEHTTVTIKDFEPVTRMKEV